MDKDNHLIFEAYVNESMPYPLFAKLAKHVTPKCSKEKETSEPTIHDLSKEDPREPHLDREEEERRLDPKCWKGYHKQGTKMKGGVRVNNCVKNEQEEGYSLPSLYQFHKMLQSFDSTYEYSDDPSAYRRGQQQHNAIRKAIEKGGKSYEDLYKEYRKNIGNKEFKGPEKTRDEIDQDADLLRAMAARMKEVSQHLIHDIDANSITHPQQLWDLYYPAYYILSQIIAAGV